MVLNLLSLSQHIQRETQQRDNPYDRKTKKNKKTNKKSKDVIIRSYYDRSDDDDETASICSFDFEDYDSDIDSFCCSSSVKSCQSSTSSSRLSATGRTAANTTIEGVKLLSQDHHDDDDEDSSEHSIEDMFLLRPEDRSGSDTSSSLKDFSFRPNDSSGSLGELLEGDMLALDISAKEQLEDEDKKSKKKTNNNAFQVMFQLRGQPVGSIVEAVMEDTTFGRNINFLQRKLAGGFRRSFRKQKKETP